MVFPLKFFISLWLLEGISGSFWHHSNGILYKDGFEITLRGITWFGLESTDRAPSGLWSSHSENSATIGHSISWFTGKIKDLGFNTLAIPLSPQSLSSDEITYPTASWAKTWDPSLKTGVAVLNSMLTEAHKFGLYIIFLFDSCNDGLTGSNSPGHPLACSGYSLDNWVADLKFLSLLSKKFPNIIGINLFTEPHYITWKTWKNYAEQAISKIYPINPNILFFVSGTDENVPGKSDWPCWGGSLFNVKSQPVDPIGVPISKIVYSVSIFYGCSLDYHSYFGYLNTGNSTVIIGLFGYNSDNVDHIQSFIQKFMNDLKVSKIRSFCYWSFNSNDPNMGYLENSDSSWCRVNLEKINKFKELGVFPKSYITDVNPPSIC